MGYGNQYGTSGYSNQNVLQQLLGTNYQQPNYGLRKIPVMEITHMDLQIPVTGQQIPVSAQQIPVSAQLIPVMVRRTLVTEQPILVTEPQIILHLTEAEIFINKLKKTLGLLFSEDSPAKTRFYFQNLPS